MTGSGAVCVGEWSEMALLGLDREGVGALGAKGNDTGCDIAVILLSEAVDLNLLPPCPPFPSDLLLLRPLYWLILSLFQGARGWRKKKGPRKEQ